MSFFGGRAGPCVVEYDDHAYSNHHIHHSGCYHPYEDRKVAGRAQDSMSEYFFKIQKLEPKMFRV